MALAIWCLILIPYILFTHNHERIWLPLKAVSMYEQYDNGCLVLNLHMAYILYGMSRFIIVYMPSDLINACHIFKL